MRIMLLIFLSLHQSCFNFWRFRSSSFASPFATPLVHLGRHLVLWILRNTYFIRMCCCLMSWRFVETYIVVLAVTMRLSVNQATILSANPGLSLRFIQMFNSAQYTTRLLGCHEDDSFVLSKYNNVLFVTTRLGQPFNTKHQFICIFN